MNVASNGDTFADERERLLTEIAILKQQRTRVMRELSECRRDREALLVVVDEWLGD